MTAQHVETLFEEHRNLIDRAIRVNYPLLSALGLEADDAAQDLSVAMLSAIKKFDPERSESLPEYLTFSLQYEILNIKRRHKPHGMTGIPRGERISFRYFDAEKAGDYEYTGADDTSALELSELLESLTAPESEVIGLKVQGFSVRRKAQAAVLDGVRRKYSAIYENEGRIAA